MVLWSAFWPPAPAQCAVLAGGVCSGSSPYNHRASARQLSPHSDGAVSTETVGRYLGATPALPLSATRQEKNPGRMQILVQLRVRRELRRRLPATVFPSLVVLIRWDNRQGVSKIQGECKSWCSCG